MLRDALEIGEAGGYTRVFMMVRLRLIAGLTLAPDCRGLAIIVSDATLLFPVDSFRVNSAGSGWTAALE